MLGARGEREGGSTLLASFSGAGFLGIFFFIGLLFSTFLQASVMAMVLVKQLLALDAESM